ncbi:hypothetical protein QQP08_011582 [Theobroma cacao]|nr:hypothetical protein QQP08_011582 [Theobroma cacao]
MKIKERKKVYKMIFEASERLRKLERKRKRKKGVHFLRPKASSFAKLLLLYNVREIKGKEYKRKREFFFFVVRSGGRISKEILRSCIITCLLYEFTSVFRIQFFVGLIIPSLKFTLKSFQFRSKQIR